MAFLTNTERPRSRAVAACVVAYVLVGAFLVRDSIAIPATRWMNIFDPSDFTTPASLGSFLAELRVPIPPIIGAAEIMSFQLTGTPDLVTVFGYRLAMILGFATALYLGATSRLRLVGSFLASLVFLWGTVRVHPFNPQVYDVVFPAFVLLWIACLGWAATQKPGVPPFVFAFLSGFFLSMAELTRPFFVLILPFALVGSGVYLALRRRGLALALFLPVLVLSGGWHLHLLLSYGQVFWSNHGGFNLAHAWPQVGIRPEFLLPEPDSTPILPGRWENLNTDAHTVNSARLTAEVIRYVERHPGRAFTHALTRISVYMVGPVPSTALPGSVIPVRVYQWAMAAALTFLVVEISSGAVVLFWTGPGSLRLFATPAGLLALTAFGCLVLQAIGSSVEEARLVLGLLPLAAALPSLGVVEFMTSRAGVARHVELSLIALGLLGLLAALAWDPLRGVPFEFSNRQVAGAMLAGGLLLKGLVLVSLGRRQDRRSVRA